MAIAQHELTFPLVSRRRLIGLAFGSMRSARRRTGSDIAGSRPYHPGDDVDTIDWAASARLSSARGTDEFVVREHIPEEAPRAVIVCDRRPEMALFPSTLPWLSKPAAMRQVGELIADSTVKARGLVGYLDYANVANPAAEERTDEPFWRPPHSQTDFWRVKESHLVFPTYHAPRDNLSRALHFLAPLRRALPAGSFVFLLSDFLEPPSSETWARVLELPWDIVPVVIQDPTWEQSFPPISSVVVPLFDPSSGRLRLLRLTRREAEERKRANEERLERLLGELTSFGLEPLLVSTSEREDIFRVFLSWAEQRLHGLRERL